MECGIISLSAGDYKLTFRCTHCGKVECTFQTFVKHSLLHFAEVKNTDIQTLYDTIYKKQFIRDESEDFDVGLLHKETVIKEEDALADTVTAAWTPNVSSSECLSEQKAANCNNDQIFTKQTNVSLATLPKLLNPTEEEELNDLENQILNVDIEKSIAKSQKRRRRPKVKKLKCDICGKMVSCPSDMTIHRNGHLGIKPYSCDKCDSSFTSVSNLRHHVNRIHLRTKPYLCNDCGKTFHTSTELATHQRSHTKELPFKCKECPRAFILQGSLTEHMRRHRNERPHKCQECDWRFFDKASLKDHILVHSDKRPFECSLCKSKFRRQYHLKNHMKIHTGLREYICTICNAQFAQKCNLTSHMKRLHSDEMAKTR